MSDGDKGDYLIDLTANQSFNMNAQSHTVNPNGGAFKSVLQPNQGDLQDPEDEKVSKGKQIKEKMKNKIAKVKQDIKDKKDKKRSKNGKVNVSSIKEKYNNSDGDQNSGSDSEEFTVKINNDNPYLNVDYM